MFILSSISSSLKVWLVSHISIYENFESEVFKNVKYFGEMCYNWPNTLLSTNVCNTLESCW